MSATRLQRLGRLCRFAGIAALLAALSLTCWNLWDARQATKRAAAVADALVQQMGEPRTAPPETEAAAATGPLPTIEIDGVAYLGLLSIPAADLELPVAAEYSYEQLATSPCRFAGSYRTGNLVICAHNYPHHFWPLLSLEMGSEVTFVAVDGTTYRYVATNRETLGGTEVARLTGTSESDGWDLSLSTCYLGGATRCVIRCAR